MRMIISLLLGISQAALGGELVEVAMLDTGIANPTHLTLCRPPLNYTHGTAYDQLAHGEYVGRLIQQAAGDVKVCIESHKVVETRNRVMGYKKALDSLGPKVKWVNISLEPGEMVIEGEYKAFKRILERGVGVVLAAGNKGSKRLTAPCKWYPHCYTFPTHLMKRWHIIGAKSPKPDYATGKLINGRETGRVKIGPDTVLYGTSFAAPRFLGKMIRNGGKDDRD